MLMLRPRAVISFCGERLLIFNANNFNTINTLFVRLNLKLYFIMSDWRPVFANHF